MKSIIKIASMTMVVAITLSSFSSCITLAVTSAVTGAVVATATLPIRIAGKGIEIVTEEMITDLCEESQNWGPTFIAYKNIPDVIVANDTSIYILDSNLKRQAWKEFGFDTDEIKEISSSKNASHANQWRNVKWNGLSRTIKLDYGPDSLAVIYYEENYTE